MLDPVFFLRSVRATRWGSAIPTLITFFFFLFFHHILAFRLACSERLCSLLGPRCRCTRVAGNGRDREAVAVIELTVLLSLLRKAYFEERKHSKGSVHIQIVVARGGRRGYFHR